MGPAPNTFNPGYKTPDSHPQTYRGVMDTDEDSANDALEKRRKKKFNRLDVCEGKNVKMK